VYTPPERENTTQNTPKSDDEKQMKKLPDHKKGDILLEI